MDRVLQMEPNNYQAKQLKELITKKIRRGTSLSHLPSSSPRLLLSFSYLQQKLRKESGEWRLGSGERVYVFGGWRELGFKCND